MKPAATDAGSFLRRRGVGVYGAAAKVTVRSADARASSKIERASNPVSSRLCLSQAPSRRGEATQPGPPCRDAPSNPMACPCRFRRGPCLRAWVGGRKLIPSAVTSSEPGPPKCPSWRYSGGISATSPRESWALRLDGSGCTTPLTLYPPLDLFRRRVAPR